jgi:hypothetical protein
MNKTTETLRYIAEISYPTIFPSLSMPTDQIHYSLLLLNRIFVSTWNVGGKAPTAELNMDDFVPPDDNSDIYVLG